MRLLYKFLSSSILIKYHSFNSADWTFFIFFTSRYLDSCPQLTISQLAVFDEYTRHEEAALFCATTSILVTKKRHYFGLRRVYSSRRNGAILCYDEYTRREETALFCVATSILVAKKQRYFVLRRVYSSRRNGTILRCDEYTRHA